MAPKNNRENIKLFSKLTEDDIMGFYRLFSNQSEKLSKISDLYKGANILTARQPTNRLKSN